MSNHFVGALFRLGFGPSAGVFMRLTRHTTTQYQYHMYSSMYRCCILCTHAVPLEEQYHHLFVVSYSIIRVLYVQELSMGGWPLMFSPPLAWSKPGIYCAFMGELGRQSWGGGVARQAGWSKRRAPKQGQQSAVGVLGVCPTVVFHKCCGIFVTTRPAQQVNFCLHCWVLGRNHAGLVGPSDTIPYWFKTCLVQQYIIMCAIFTAVDIMYDIEYIHAYRNSEIPVK